MSLGNNNFIIITFYYRTRYMKFFFLLSYFISIVYRFNYIAFLKYVNKNGCKFKDADKL
jgi:hypothetical protein